MRAKTSRVPWRPPSLMLAEGYTTGGSGSAMIRSLQVHDQSHRPTRQRERRTQGFKSPGHAQRFLSSYGLMAQHFRPRRHLLSAAAYREEMRNRFEHWAEMTGTERAA